VIHLATEADLAATRANPHAATEVIAGGTRRTLEVAVHTGVRRFLFTSSGSVYGPQPDGDTALSEDRALPAAGSDGRDAATIGAEAKRQAEAYCADFGRERGLETVIARCFTFAGPAMPLDGKFAFGNFMRNALAGERIVLKGDGTPIRSYMYGADLAIWLWTLLARGRAGSVYNVGSEEAIRLRDLAEAMARELAAPGIEIQKEPVPGRPVDRYVPSTQKAQKELGLRETTGWLQSIRKTADWLRH
jgi:dTDP-glucose 4,6-dehydratase